MTMHRHLLPVAALLLAGCASMQPPQPGASTESVLQHWGQPTARYALTEGASRLEYATGPFGRMTWMVDLDGAGRVTRSRQVLNEAEFQQVQQAQNLTRDDLLRWLGTPGERRRVRYPVGEIWSWRYPTNDCLWFESAVGDDGRVIGSSYASDPRCDAPSDKE